MNKLTDQSFRIKLLIATNIVTLTLLIVSLVLDRNTETRQHNSVNTEQPSLIPHSFLDNESYTELTDIYTAYTSQKNIVMLGNSLTYRINWTELLGRADIANRGIGSDITAGYVYRINFVLNTHPKICFIEGGVNDIAYNIHQDTIIKNLNTLIDTLQKNKIIPVLTAVTYVAENYRNAISFNQKIKALNKQILHLANERNVLSVDLNPRLTDGVFLKKEYAIADGIHFTGSAYLIWKEALIKILQQQKI